MNKLRASLIYAAICCLFPSFAMAQTPASSDANDVYQGDSERFAYEHGGVNINIGIGYTPGSSVNGSISLGYQFKPINESITFSLNAAFMAAAPNPCAYSAMFVPKMHLLYHSFMFAFGLGIGYGQDDWGYESFSIKPEVQFDWFLGQNIYLGFGADLPIYLTTKKDPFCVTSGLCNDTNSGVSYPNAYLHLGYKF